MRFAWGRVAAVLIASWLIPSSVLLGVEAAWVQAELPGADIRSLAIDPADANRVVAGTSSGQIFVTGNGGESWAPPGDLVTFPGWVVSDLLFDPHEPGRLWAALWSIWGSSGRVMVSDDLGVTWEDRIEGLSGRQVYALAIAPHRPGSIYAALRGGVYGSRDGGLSWRHLTEEFPDLGKVTSLLIAPSQPDTVLAGTWRRAYRSDDGGETWRGIFQGMVLDSEVFSLQVGKEPGELWASTCGWVYRGQDWGESWRRYTEGLKQRRTPSFAVLPSGRLLAGTVTGLYASDDGGLRWSPVEPQGVAVMTIEAAEDDPGRVYVGTEGSAVWRSIDGGRTFAEVARGMNSVRIAGLGRDGSEILAWVRHAGRRNGVRVSNDGGMTFTTAPGRRSEAARAGTVTEVDSKRALATGDERAPMLIFEEDRRAQLMVRGEDGRRRDLRVSLPVPSRDISSALLADDVLVLGTASYGVFTLRVPVDRPAAIRAR